MVRQSADQLQRVSMELGGNAPFIVFEDADLDAAVEGAMLAKMRNMGEACTAANRFLVHSSVADDFAHRLADRMGALTGRARPGRGRGRRPAHRREGGGGCRLRSSSTDAVHDGARVLVGGAAGRRRGVLLPAHRAGRCPDRGSHQPRGDLRPRRADHHLRDRGRGDRAGQRHRVRPGVLRLHPRPGPDHPGRRGPRLRHGRHQHRPGVQRRRAVRRGEGERVRSRGRVRGDRGVPRDHLRGTCPV